MTDEHLTANNLYRAYKVRSEPIKILRGVSLSVKRSEKVFLQGHSGAGKTTLLYTLAGLEKPDSGGVTLNEVSIYEVPAKISAKIRNNFIGFVFQNYHLLPEFSALENILIPSFINKKENLERAIYLLDKVGLIDRRDHLPTELSGGEQQRIAIARALINDPEIIFADEPTGNLDTKNSHQIMEILIGLADEFKRTLVIVTHNDELANLGDRKFILKDGKIFS